MAIALVMMVIGFAAMAKPVCVGGVCYPDEETARAAGVLLPADHPATNQQPNKPTGKPANQLTNQPTNQYRRLAMGYMAPAEFVAFLRNEPPPEGRLEDHALWMVLLLVLVGGLAANLTPCVLPLVPVNLIIIGRGWKRGAAYAAGITTTYGVLGLAAAFGGLAFGTLQSSPYFNFGVAVVFTVLALAMLGAFSLPAIRVKFWGSKNGRAVSAKPPEASSGRVGAPRTPPSLLKPYLLGLGSATLASACVEPILIATLLLTAKWFAAGRFWAVALPFVLGLGMGLPYPFAAAGFSVLPKPGEWMIWVKRAFALVFFAMALWYGAAGSRLLFGEKEAEARFEETQSPAPKGAKMLLKIGAPWCRNCKAMDRTVFNDPEVVKALAEFAAVRRIEIDNFTDLAKYPELEGLDIKGLPAYVVIEGEKTR